MLNIRSFTGGVAQTNGYLVEAPGGSILVDAPEGACDWVRSEGAAIGALLLTHMHYDHVLDAAKLRAEHGCEVIAHEAATDDLTLVALLAAMGMEIDLRPFPVDRELRGARDLECLGLTMGVRHVPGHSPDSLCFVVERATRNGSAIVFGGDVLFRGSIGRTDFPHGDHELLLAGIRRELLTLEDATVVYPGHGPPTTVGEERVKNPFLAD